MAKDPRFANIPPLPPPRRHSRSSFSSNVSISPPVSPRMRPEPDAVKKPILLADYSFNFNIPSFVVGLITAGILQLGGKPSLWIIVFLAVILLTQKSSPQSSAAEPTAAIPPLPSSPICTSPRPSVSHLTPHALPRTPSPRRERRSPSPRIEGARFDSPAVADEVQAFRPYGERRSIIYSGEDISRLD